MCAGPFRCPCGGYAGASIYILETRIFPVNNFGLPEPIHMDTQLALTEAQRLAEMARQGLRIVAGAEDQTIFGWLLYGQALNAGRKLFPKGDDRRFSRWLSDSNLLFGVEPMDRAAAIWAASDMETFTATQRANPRVRTVRGLHAKWKEERRPKAEPERDREEPTEAERETVPHLNCATVWQLQRISCTKPKPNSRYVLRRNLMGCYE